MIEPRADSRAGSQQVEPPRFDKIAMIGLGLIGSSICHAIRRGGLAGEISGTSRSAETRRTAIELGLVDTMHETAAEAVSGADLVILCIPVGACGAIAREIGPTLRKGAILTDVGSVKAAVINEVSPYVPDGVSFIGGHPIAGTEYSGPAAGFAELFDDRWCILTPTNDLNFDSDPNSGPNSGLDSNSASKADIDAIALARLKAFWEALGSNVEIMSPEHHDMVLAITSHLPHLIAFNIVDTAAHLERVTDTEVIKFSAGGFRDFTRIAASDPTMWRDVFLKNKGAVLEMLGRFSEDLTALQRAIRYDDGDQLFRTFEQSRAIRRSIVEAGQDTDDVDFGRHRSPKSVNTTGGTQSKDET